jgi:hypothetical protein
LTKPAANGERAGRGNIMEKLTKSQSWALFCISGYDVRETSLTKSQASDLIDAAKTAKAKVIEQIASLEGAIQKRKAGSSKADHAALFERAHEAGMAAVEACTPTPMIVQQRANPLDDRSPVVHEYEPVMDGVCGFAWVNVRPGNCGFARYLKAERGARKGYYGGMEMWIHAFNQSMEKKLAYANGFAEVVRAAGIDAYAGSRMD